MKKIKIEKEIEVTACEICGKEIDQAIMPLEICLEKKKGIFVRREKEERYNFHYACVEELLIKTAKKK